MYEQGNLINNQEGKRWEKNQKTYFSPPGKSQEAQPFTKPGFLENHKTTSNTNKIRTFNSA